MGGHNLLDIRLNHDEAAEAYRCFLKAEGPIEPFDVSAQQALPGTNLQFTDQNPNATSWSWDFGDGNQSTQQNPTHAYNNTGTYEVSLTVEGSGCVFTSTQSVVVSNTVSIETELADEISIYPNPTSGQLQIELGERAENDLTIALFDLMGRKALASEHMIQKGETQGSMDLRTLAPGWYILRISADQLVRSFRIRKN